MPLQPWHATLEAILARKPEVVGICPQAVMQALVLRMDSLVVGIYTGSAYSKGEHGASFHEASILQSELGYIREWLRHHLSLHDEIELDWPISWGEKRCRRYYDMLWEDVYESKDAWATMEVPGNVTDAEWWPCRGTLIALLRHGGRSGLLSRQLVDV